LTCRRQVRPRQWERRRGMIERRRLPESCRMTLRAIVAEIASHMVGIGCTRKIGRMTLIAIRIVQLIISIHMT
jgi:hypothetical protein